MSQTLLPNPWTPLRYHPEQYKLWHTRAKFICAAAGRGSGKTEVTRRRQVRWLAVKQPGVDRPLHGYALPTFSQARRVAWEPILQLIPKSWISRVSNTEMSVETRFGSKLYVLGMDRPERAEGVQWSTFVLDESSDQRPGVFDKSILPALSHNCEWAARIGVPKRVGPGAKEFRAAWEAGLNPDDPSTLSLMWPSRDIVSPETIAWAKANLDPQDFKEQYEADWLDMGGGVYYGFDSILNVTETASYRPNEPILVGSDFNVDPMSWVVAHMVDGKLYQFDELYIHNTNTKRTLDELHRRYGTHKGGWFFTGDASSKARKTSADFSDYHIINADDRFENKRVVYPRSNPSIASRISTVNAACLNALEERRYKVHPRCEQTIGELESLSYKPGTREINTAGNVGHITDALGYLILHFLPIQLQSPIQRVHYA